MFFIIQNKDPRGGSHEDDKVEFKYYELFLNVLP